MTFFHSPALAEGIEWAVMSHPRHWFCHIVGRRHVASEGRQSCEQLCRKHVGTVVFEDLLSSFSLAGFPQDAKSPHLWH